MINDSSSSSENEIERVLSGKGKQKGLNVDAWITKVIFEKDTEEYGDV